MATVVAKCESLSKNLIYKSTALLYSSRSNQTGYVLTNFFRFLYNSYKIKKSSSDVFQHLLEKYVKYVFSGKYCVWIYDRLCFDYTLCSTMFRPYINFDFVIDHGSKQCSTRLRPFFRLHFDIALDQKGCFDHGFRVEQNPCVLLSSVEAQVLQNHKKQRCSVEAQEPILINKTSAWNISHQYKTILWKRNKP